MPNTNQDSLKYQKLYHWAHTLITSGVIKNMDKFPSETSLQKKFGYSRQTVRTALQQLEEEGLITRVRGSGTYVCYDGSTIDEKRSRVGLLLSYYSDLLGLCAEAGRPDMVIEFASTSKITFAGGGIRWLPFLPPRPSSRRYASRALSRGPRGSR